MKPSKKTLGKLKSEIYINAVRLFSDACILYSKRSYASAYALSILSLEALGKFEMVGHICYDMSINP
jgi:AbiV family abortive infection protein